MIWGNFHSEKCLQGTVRWGNVCQGNVYGVTVLQPKKPNTIEACKYFNKNDHTFSKHGKVIIIEHLQNINTTPTKTITLTSNETENF